MAGCCCRTFVPSLCPGGWAAETALIRYPKGLLPDRSPSWGGDRQVQGGAGGDLLTSSTAIPLNKAGAHI